MTKKRKKWPIVLGSIALVLLLIAGYTGFVPILSDIMGTNSPRDLGIEYTKQDYLNAMNKAGFTLDNSAGLGPDTKISYSGQKQINAQFTQEEISALLSFDHAEKFPAKDVQVKINEDGSLEASARIKLDDYKGISIDNAVYIKGKPELVAPNRISLEKIDKLEIGRVPTPVTEEIKSRVEDEINNKLNSIPGLNVESLDVKNGVAGLKGTIPESAKRVPR